MSRDDEEEVGLARAAGPTWTDYEGAPKYATLRRLVYLPGDPLHDFCFATNPFDREIAIVFNEGPHAELMVRRERQRPKSEQLPDNVIKERLLRGIPLRREYVRTRVVWGPRATVEIPKFWRHAMQTIRDGRVVAGVAMEFVFSDSPDQQPTRPPITDALKPKPVRAAKGRTR